MDHARIADGVLELTRVEQQRFAYTVTPRFAGAARGFVLEQTLPAGWQVAAPADAVVDGEAKFTIERSLEARHRWSLQWCSSGRGCSAWR